MWFSNGMITQPFLFQQHNTCLQMVMGYLKNETGLLSGHHAQVQFLNNLRPRQTCQTFCQTSVFDKCLTGFPQFKNRCLTIFDEKIVFDESLFQNKFFVKHFRV